MTTWNTPRRAVAAVTLALSLALAACGGDDGDDASAGADTPAGDVDRDAGLCSGLEAMRETFADLDEQALEDPALLDDMAEALTDLRDAAPDELEADFQLVASYFEELAPLLPRLQELGAELATSGDDAERVQELEQELEDLQTRFTEATDGQEFDQATERIATYATDVCGIEGFSTDEG